MVCVAFFFFVVVVVVVVVVVLFSFFIAGHILLSPAQIKPKSFESRRNLFVFFFYPGRMRLMFTGVIRRHVASTALLANYKQWFYYDVPPPTTAITASQVVVYGQCHIEIFCSSQWPLCNNDILQLQ